MSTLFEGAVRVQYGQVYVLSDPSLVDVTDCFVGQRNGLCGAAAEGRLFLVTGLHTGHVAFRVELHEREPPLDPLVQAGRRWSKRAHEAAIDRYLLQILARSPSAGRHHQTNERHGRLLAHPPDRLRLRLYRRHRRR